MHFIANRRCAQLGLARVFDETENPFPWMSEAMDLKKEKNFFETRVIEYQNGGALSWESGVACLAHCARSRDPYRVIPLRH